MADKKGFDLGGFHARAQRPTCDKRFDLEGCGDGVGYQPVHIDSDVPGKTS